MLDEFGKYLWAHSPGVCVLVSITIIVFILCWKMFRLYGRLEKVEDHCSKIQGINTDSASVKDQLTKISNSIDKLFVFLNQQHQNFPTELFVSKSPIQLTEFGEKVLVTFEGQSYIDTNLKSLISLMEKENFKSALDVQNFAQSILFSQTQNDGFTPIKNFIFNNPNLVLGESRIDLTLPLALNLMSIYLRNKYFDVYPDLKDVEQADAT